MRTPNGAEMKENLKEIMAYLEEVRSDDPDEFLLNING